MSKRSKTSGDLIWHRARYRGYRFEIWQTAATIGRPPKAFYSLRLNLAAYPQVERRQNGFVSLAEAIAATMKIIDQRQAAVTRARRNIKYQPPWRGEARLIERLPKDDGPFAFILPDTAMPAGVIDAYRHR